MPWLILSDWYGMLKKHWISWGCSLFWDVTQCKLAIHLPKSRDNLWTQSSRTKQFKNSSWRNVWPLKMWSIVFPETSVNNYQSTLHNVPEEQRSHLQAWNQAIRPLLTFPPIGPASELRQPWRYQSPAKSKQNKLIRWHKSYTTKIKNTKCKRADLAWTRNYTLQV
jgi:hypothetical protein